VRPYFGDGDEFQMGFHFPVMPRLYMALKKGDRSPIEWIIQRTPAIPETAQWCTFLRNHDELTLEMVTEEERQWMWQQYAPEPRMRLNLGIRRRLAPLLDNDRRKIELADSLLFTLPGSPVIYYGDEIGMGDNIELFDRNGVRTPMQWSSARNAGFSAAGVSKLYAPVIDNETFGYRSVNVEAQRGDPASLWNTLRRMIAERKQHPAFGWGTFEWAAFAGGDTPAVAAYWRRYQDDRLLIVQNLSDTARQVQISLPGLETAGVQDILSGLPAVVVHSGRLDITLAPYGYHWLEIRPVLAGGD